MIKKGILSSMIVLSILSVCLVYTLYTGIDGSPSYETNTSSQTKLALTSLKPVQIGVFVFLTEGPDKIIAWLNNTIDSYCTEILSFRRLVFYMVLEGKIQEKNVKELQSYLNTVTVKYKKIQNPPCTIESLTYKYGRKLQPLSEIYNKMLMSAYLDNTEFIFLPYVKGVFQGGFLQDIQANAKTIASGGMMKTKDGIWLNAKVHFEALGYFCRDETLLKFHVIYKANSSAEEREAPWSVCLRYMYCSNDMHQSRKMLCPLPHTNINAIETNGTFDKMMNRDLLEKKQLLRWRSYVESKHMVPLVTKSKTDFNVISMSLYGANPKYTLGAIRNALLLNLTFPGWRLRFYIPPVMAKKTIENNVSVPENIISKLRILGAEIKEVNKEEMTEIPPMMWRFLVADDPNVDVFIIRDSDGRLTSRDSYLVNDWLKSEATFHCVRDHPSHSLYTVSGGLWGARSTALRELVNDTWCNLTKGKSEEYFADMDLLQMKIWPKVKDHAYCHDSFSCDRWPSSHPILVDRRGTEHLGQVYDPWGVPRQKDITIIKLHHLNSNCSKNHI